MSIDSSKVLITAGASGIGRAIAEAFTLAGASVHIADIDPTAVERMCQDNPG